MTVKMDVSAERLVARIDKLLPSVREALVEALGPLARAMASDAQDRAAAHIRYLGKKPGQYLASIYGGTFDKDSIVGGFVRSGNPLAHLLEWGASVGPHEILPRIADALAFEGSAGTAFAARVQNPGAEIPPYPAIGPAFEAAKDDIEAAVRKAIGETR